MKREYKITLYPKYLFLCVVIFISSCKKFVTIDPPLNQLVTQSVFSSNATATSAQIGIYTNMEANGDLYNAAYFTGLSGDELTNYSTDIGTLGYYTNTMNPLNTNASDIWSPAYSYIYQANAIIAALKNNSALNQKVVQQLTGESEFIRAYWYFYLVNLFGDVPLATTTDYSINGVISRTPKDQVYQQIKTDLIDAISKLSTNYIDATDTTVTIERTRPNKWVAMALLARLYLFMEDWSNAETEASAIIDNKSLYDTVPLNMVFHRNSKEAIWQLQPVFPGYNTIEGANFILTDVPQGYLTNCSTISDQLLSAFEIGDNREVSWISSISIDGITYSFPFKYQVQFASAVTEYSMVLRLAEQYLIRAEARTRQGNTLGAAADLNIIRNRARLPNTAVTSQTDLLSAILHERQVELFAECGHRWMDLKRTGAINNVMSNVTPSKGGGSWVTTAQLYPIPQTELDSDPNLIQNKGY